jgi:uncharacterized membrane protein
VTRAFWIDAFVFLHVLGAITAVGPTLTYGLWISRATPGDLGVRAFVLRTVSWVDRHLATPSFMVQAATGTALVLLLRLRFWHTAWLLGGVGLYALTAVFAITVYAPVIRRQIALAERAAADPADPAVEADYRRTAARARTLGLAAVALTLAIVFLMVVKPALWSAG